VHLEIEIEIEVERSGSPIDRDIDRGREIGCTLR